MKKIITALVLALTFTAGIAAQKQPTFVDKAKTATAMLVSQNETGGMDVRCTATIFKKDGKKYYFVSAAHCIGSDDVAKEKAANANNQSFYITFDETVVKAYFQAKTVSVGYQHRGDDFSVYEVLVKDREGKEVDPDWNVIPLGDEGKEKEGNSVLNPANPQGLGIQLFRGNISSLYLDRPVVQGDINWKGVMMLQMPGTNGGSSGSAIISEQQEAIVGFLVGTIGDTTVTAVPVSRFKDFLKRVENGTYPWMRKAEDQ